MNPFLVTDLLKHDTALDARFVRSFFNISYVAAFASATATSISFALPAMPRSPSALRRWR